MIYEKATEINVNDKILRYIDMLNTFRESSYRFEEFGVLIPNRKSLLLRHDVDFDLHIAETLAVIENSNGFRATYFFMLRSKFYNIFNLENLEIVNRIKSLGHSISIHFDPTGYSDINKGLQTEMKWFEELFGIRPKCISIHRPSEEILIGDKQINSIDHTYQSKYIKDISYFSDSRGGFRFGNPVESNAFMDGLSIHLLIHPVWWVLDGSNAIETLDNLVEIRKMSFMKNIAIHCIPYRSKEGVRLE